MRLRLVVPLLVFTIGCGGPYKGKPEKLPKVKKSAEPAEVAAEAAPVVIKYDEECNAKFSDDFKMRKTNSSAATNHVNSGDDRLATASASTDPAIQVNNIILAIEDYKKALLQDHYSPDATYGLAVAYAQVRKKGCALKLLKRLAELQNQARVSRGKVDSLLNAVEDETAFKGFKNEAMAAIGR